VVKHANGFHTGATVSGELPMFPSVSADLDTVDVRLLGCLVEDARQSLRQIGRILDVSEHTVRARLKRLEDSGLIKIHAQVDPNATNGNQELAYVALRAQNSQVQRVIDDMVDRSEFWTVDRTVGEYNVLALAHAGSREQLADIVDELRSASGIERSETWALSSLQLSAFPWGRF
jgi:Lrp/AsnC family transcriptional regulator for asnA, asnC and gidA